MILGNRYELLEPLGGGGMATIYRGWDRSLERFVAIKRLKAEHASDPRWRNQFLVEAQTLAAARHPHVVEVFDVGLDDERPYLVMELIEGPTLASLLPLAPIDVVEYLLPVADALACCHAHGVVHCDIKPPNIMIDRHGCVKLVDFGIATLAGTVASGLLVGSPHYVAPERVMGGVLTPAVDVYAMGIMMFQAVTGTTPFNGSDAASIARQHVDERVPLMSDVLVSVPLALERVVCRATAPAPVARYADGGALGEALRNARADLLGVPVLATQHEASICSATDFWAQGTAPVPVAAAA
jgi:eukaryotic-like serine/threonine-protein kinase